MSNPLPSDVHINTALQNILVAYMQDPGDYVSSVIAPTVPVTKQSDYYFEWKRDSFFRNDVRKRAPGTQAPATTMDLLKSGPYFSDVYDLAFEIADETQGNADTPLSLDMSAVEQLAQQHKINQDASFVTNFFTTSKWTGVDGTLGHDITGSTSVGTRQVIRWDLAGSTPLEDVKAQSVNIRRRTGKKPNVLILGADVTAGLLNNPEIVDRVKYTQLGFLDLQLLAAAFGVDKVVDAAAIQNTATEGATFNPSFIFGKGALLAYVEPNPGLMKASAMYTFAWRGYMGDSSDTVTFKYPVLERHVQRIEVFRSYDMRIVGADLGVYYTTIVS